MTKRVTALDVAKTAGVSRTTVSFVLNNVEGMRISDETRKRVLKVAAELNYYPDATARRMAKGKTSIIGFVLRQEPDKAYADLFLPEVMRGISDVANEKGYHVLFAPIPPDENNKGFHKLIHERQADGLIISGPLAEDEELVQLYEDGAPIVLMGKLANANIPHVDVDNIESAKMAVSQLIKLGHKQIAMVTNASRKYTSCRDRLEGYKVALEEASIPFNEKYVVIGDRTPESGHHAMQSLLNISPRPTALFIASDTVALGCMNALYQNRIRVPEDVAIVGFDDIPLSKFIAPPLSTIRLPAYGLGWGAANLLVQWLEEKQIPTHEVILETELIVRESCGALIKKT
jgi:LacI family transcriptional regulator